MKKISFDSLLENIGIYRVSVQFEFSFWNKLEFFKIDVYISSQKTAKNTKMPFWRLTRSFVWAILNTRSVIVLYLSFCKNITLDFALGHTDFYIIFTHTDWFSNIFITRRRTVKNAINCQFAIPQGSTQGPIFLYEN